MLWAAAFVMVSGSHVFAALSGSGTELNPYLIQSLADFNEWRSNGTTYWAAGKYTSLTTDLDLGGETYNGYVVGITFAGNFNGTPSTRWSRTPSVQSRHPSETATG